MTGEVPMTGIVMEPYRKVEVHAYGLKKQIDSMTGAYAHWAKDILRYRALISLIEGGLKFKNLQTVCLHLAVDNMKLQTGYEVLVKCLWDDLEFLRDDHPIWYNYALEKINDILRDHGYMPDAAGLKYCFEQAAAGYLEEN